MRQRCCVYFAYMATDSSSRSKLRREKFVALATRRVNRTIKDLRLIGNLSNRAAYAYTDDDVKKIIRALQRELDAVKARFSGPGQSGESDFSL